MPQYRYQATDRDGRTQSGTIAARDEPDARRQLSDLGLNVAQLTVEQLTVEGPSPQAASGAHTASPRLNSSDAEEIVAQLAEIGKANIPLSVGLRAAASESTNRRVRRALQHLARATDQGKSLEAALSAEVRSFPPHVGGLITAATQTAQLGSALEELLDHHRRMRDIRRTVLAGLAYPLLVFGMATILFLFVMIEIVPVFAAMFEDFELDLPVPTMSLIKVSDAFVSLTMGDQKWLMLSVGTTTVLALLIVRLIAGAGGWRRFLGTAPLFGPIVSWSGAAAFAQMLGVLLDYEIPLPRALELTADGVRDGNVREACQAMAIGAADGHSMSSLLEQSSCLPETLVPFVRSGELQGDLADALKIASQVFFERIELRATLLSSVSPPIIFIFIVVGIAYSVISLFMPLVSITTSLA